jgi:short-subunit dehydrogenase
MPNAIIIGASSGIGKELAKTLARNGFNVGLAARRLDLLEAVARDIPTRAFVKVIDVSKPDEAMQLLRELIAEMKDVDLFVISAGTGFINPKLEWKLESETIAVNVSGFTAIANVALEHLQARGSGQLVGISSIAALRGNREAPAYNASKAFMSNYLQGLSHKFARLRLPITVTDVQLGFVDTAMAKADRKFWMPVRKKPRHRYLKRYGNGRITFMSPDAGESLHGSSRFFRTGWSTKCNAGIRGTALTGVPISTPDPRIP